MPPVKSLLELATMVCIKNIKGLESVGDYLPYESVRHILLKVDNAYQLRQIELNSPQLQGETGEVWIKIIENDFPLEYKATAYKPQSPDKWYRVWEKYKREHDRAIEESENKLKNALAGLKQDKEKNTSKIVERKFLPQAGRVRSKRAWGQRDTATSVLTFNAGSRTKTNTGASVMRKVRREVQEIAAIHGNLSRPIRGPSRQTEVRKAPSAMVLDYRRAANPQYRTTSKAPEPLSAVEQYEKRATFISDSEDSDDDAPFGEHAKETTKSPAPKKPAVPSTKNPVTAAAKVSLLKRKSSIQPVVLRPVSSAKPTTKAQPTSPATPKQTAKTPSTTTPQKQPTSAATTKTTTTTPGKGAATLANKFRRTSANANTASNVSAGNTVAKSSTAPTAASTEADSRLPAARTTPPQDGPAGPSSPEELVAALAEAIPRPPVRKRKAIDIFMRPKKRMH